MANNSILTGSLCLSDIPKDQIKMVTRRDGSKAFYVNIAGLARKEPQTFENNGVKHTYTHLVSCSPKKEERKEGVNYFIGDLEERVFAPAITTTESIEQAPTATAADLSSEFPF